MADILDKNKNVTPASTDALYIVDDPSGTPADEYVEPGDLITKAHGLSDGIIKVASGVMTPATAGTDYSTSSATETLTNKTIDANGTGNSITNIEVADMAASAVVTAAETIAANDNDTTIPTSAAVKAYADSVATGGSINGSTGATDNALIRADGTGGSTIQSTGNTIDDSNNLTMAGDIIVGGYNDVQSTYYRANTSQSNTLQVVAGSGTSGGDLLLDSGAGTTGDGGDVQLRPGASTSGGANGQVAIVKPTTLQEMRIDNSALTVNRTLTMPDANVNLADVNTALQPSDIASGTITARTGAVNLSGGSDGDVLTVQADGSLAIETLPAGGAVAINDITDVTITTPADNEVLAYNNGTSEWINQTPAEAGLQPAPSEGAFVDGDKTKLDGIATGADVTGSNTSASTNALQSATTTVNVSSATAPTSGQVLTATSSTAATWQTPTGGGATVIDDLTDVDTDKSKTPADGDVLTFDGTHWNAETPSAGGGGNPYGANVVIAASGGDYTTLSAYFTAGATSGDIIYIENGTYTESTISNSTANLTIIGQSREGVVLAFGANTCTLNANNRIIKNLTITVSTGYWQELGTNILMDNVKISATDVPASAFGSWYPRPTNGVIRNVIFATSATGSSTNPNIRMRITESVFQNCYFGLNLSGSTATGAIQLESTSGATFSGCTFKVLNAGSGARGLYITGSNEVSITGCNFLATGLLDYGVYHVSGDYLMMTNNHFRYWFSALYLAKTSTSGATVTGNSIRVNASKTGITIPGDRNLVVGNYLYGANSGDTGISIPSGGDNNLVHGNVIMNFATATSDSGTGNDLTDNKS